MLSVSFLRQCTFLIEFPSTIGFPLGSISIIVLSALSILVLLGYKRLLVACELLAFGGLDLTTHSTKYASRGLVKTLISKLDDDVVDDLQRHLLIFTRLGSSLIDAFKTDTSVG